MAENSTSTTPASPARPTLPGMDNTPLADNLLAAIVNSSNDAIVCKDLNGIITVWNEAAQQVFGYDASEIIGQSVLRLIPKELHPEEDEILRKIRSGERLHHYETTRLRKNGERFPISVTISPVRDGSGRVVGASKIARDISERMHSDLTRFRLAAIVESADDAIISKDLNGIVQSWNEGAIRMFGYQPQEMIGQPIQRLIPDDLKDEEEGFLKRLRRGDRVDHFETVRRKKDGELIDVSVTISPIRNQDGQVVGASKIARDISDRKRMEKLLIQTEKLAATGRMAATIAHEINNPLESLVNLIFLARMNCVESPRAQSYLFTAEGELERVSHIARQTLGFYRDTSSPSELYLHDVLENVLAVYQSKLLMAGVTVQSVFNDVDKICVSRGEMLQVFSNIIANAIDAMPLGGKLCLTLRRVVNAGGDSLEAVVQDQGVGIRKEDLGQVFEPFFTTKGDLGTGIGLWVSKQLVERRGGHIAVSSSTELGNSGTCMTISLPFELPDKTGQPRNIPGGTGEQHAPARL